jgi:hypothetical protein
MKFGKITSSNVSTNALTVGAAVAGGALSGGLMTVVPQKQEKLARGGMVAVGLLGASTLKGTSSAERLVKFMLIGLALRQAGELIKGFAAPQIQVSEASTQGEKFVAGMAGLACPCDNAALAAPMMNFPALNYAETTEFVETEESAAFK